MIVAGESSGELYGALLASKLKTLWPDVNIIGVGGDRMRLAGVDLFSGIASSFGVTEALSTIRTVKETYNKTVQKLKYERPDVVVLIDYPDFNFGVGREARREGIKVLYYVSPQVWAWRSGRVKTMAEIANRIAVILPFEESIYKDVGMPCEFVGHPILDEITQLPTDRDEIKKRLGLDPEKRYLALLPGSRKHELKKLLPVMRGVVERFKVDFKDFGFVMPMAPNIDTEKFSQELEWFEKAGVVILKEGAISAMACSDTAVVASGTAALQAAFLGTPLVVIYKIFPITYWIGRLFVLNVKYISLVNILLDKPVIQELLQGRANPDTVMGELRRTLLDKEYRERMFRDFDDVQGLFEGMRPSMRVAEIVGEMAGWEL